MRDMDSQTAPLAAIADANFPEIEKAFISERVYPNFDSVRYESPSPINALTKPLFESRVAMVSTCGAHLKTDPPFNLKSPIGDHTYREIPDHARLQDIALSHMAYSIHRVSADKNCVFPLDRLIESEREGRIGSIAPRHFSFMGYIAATGPLVNETAPQVADDLRADQVDLVVLAPAPDLFAISRSD
jgi:D-proline reductase (dithiol) PrdB